QFWRIYGLPDQAPGDPSVIERLVLEEDRDIVSNQAQRRAGEARMQAEYRIRRADTGEERVIARRAEFERGPDGRPVRMVGAVQDVTERRAVQQALEATEAQFRTFVETLPSLAWSVDAEGRPLWANQRIEDYSGLTSEELARDGWRPLVHPEDRDATYARWAAALASGEIYEAEVRLRRADGEYRWHLARALPLRTPDGTISRWVGANTDIHEQKLAEVENQ